MKPKRIRTRTICETMATREGDGWWTWSVFHRGYRWNSEGWVEALEVDGGITRHIRAETIDAAIAWTVGYAIAIYHAAGFINLKIAQSN